jgi:hypothetical protein
MSSEANIEASGRESLRRIARMTAADHDSLRRHVDGDEEMLAVLDRAERVSFRIGRLSRRDVELAGLALEQARPELLMISGDDFSMPDSPEWQARIEPYRSSIRYAIRATGRIETGGVPPPPGADEVFLGTGFAIAPNAILTAAHVAREICMPDGSIKPNLSPRFDPIEEHGRDSDVSAPIVRGHFGRGLDYAVLMLAGSQAPRVLTLASSADDVSWDGSSALVYMIGYPGIPGQVSAADIQRLQGVLGVKRLCFGRAEEIRRQYLDGWHGLIDSILISDYTSIRGCSGGPVLDLRTGIALGIHVRAGGGEADAVPAWTIRDHVFEMIHT